MNELEKRGAKRPVGFIRSDGWIWRGDHWMSPEKMAEKRAKDAERKRARRADPEYAKIEKANKLRYCQKHKTKLRERILKASEESKKIKAERMRIWRKKNPEAAKEVRLRYKQRREAGQASKRLSETEIAERQNRDLLEYSKLQQIELQEKQRMETNRIIAARMRARLRSFLNRKGRYKAHNTMFYVGCSHEQLRGHIESQFKRGMTWENYGKVWHIDHIVPVSLFGTNEDELKRAMNWQNLRPLWAKQNIVEGNRRQNNQTVLPLDMP
jgi:hypothetical protein